MNVGNVRNSIYATLMENDPDDIKGITNDLLSLFICESWNRKSNEIVGVENLTDSEFRMLAVWTELSSQHYRKRIPHIKDMREIFPGLSLTAANYFVTAFNKEIT